MFKRIALGVLFVLFSGALIVGAANRTTAKTDKLTETAVVNPAANGYGEGAGLNATGDRLHENAPAVPGPVNGQGANNAANAAGETAVAQGQGQGNGRGAANNFAADVTMDCANGDCPADGVPNQNAVGGQGNGRGQQQLQDGSGLTAAPVDIIVYTGTVSQAPAAGVDLILQTGSEAVTIGVGPSALTDLGVQLAVGDELEVVGFWENGEFKANTITRLSDDLTVTLRDEIGRPYWSGGAQNGRGGGGQGGGRWNTQPNS
mgnify:CR=1 FL=1